MFVALKEYLLGRIIGVMVHRKEKLSKKEWYALQAYEDELTRQEYQKYENPMLIGMIGLVGDGKSSVAAEIAKRIGGLIVEGDRIRVELRQQGAPYTMARRIGEILAFRLISKGACVVLDSDFIDATKRASLREFARPFRYRVEYVRVTCDEDVAVGRIFEETYKNDVTDFFGGASSCWEGKNKGAIVKERERCRRMPHHYRWVNKGKTGGLWMLRKLPFKLLGTIDTTWDHWRDGDKVFYGRLKESLRSR